MRRGDIRERADVQFAADLAMIHDRYAHPEFKLVPVSDLATLVQYGTSKRTTNDASGIPVLRIPNIQARGWDIAELKYLQLSESELAIYRLEKGDILFNRTNGSRGLVGKCAVFNFEGDWVFASYLIRLRLDPNMAIPEFLSSFLNTYWGRRQVEHVSRQILMSNINAEEIRALRVPLPTLRKQGVLLASLDAARMQRDQKLSKADALIAGIDGYVLDQVGLASLPDASRNAYGIRLRDARARFDPDYQSPRFHALRHLIDHGKNAVRAIGSLCLRLQSGFAAGGDDQTDDPDVGIPHIRPLNISAIGDLHFDGTKMVPRAAVAPQDILRKGEVLFNNTNSTAWVGKSAVFDLDRECACSNHITRLQLLDKQDSPYFFGALLNALRGLGFFGLLSTSFNNQAGINAETLSSVRLPWPKASVQSRIGAEVIRRRDEAQKLRDDADTLWASAEEKFEAALLGPDSAHGGR